MKTTTMMNQILPGPNCQAVRYWRGGHGQPYSQNLPGELIFADGSKLITQPGSEIPLVVPPDGHKIQLAASAAFSKGERDRLNRLPFHPNFRRGSRRHLPVIKQAYAQGWWSPANWPRRQCRTPV
jgi:hypothetical protein